MISGGISWCYGDFRCCDSMKVIQKDGLHGRSEMRTSPHDMKEVAVKVKVDSVGLHGRSKQDIAGNVANKASW